MTANDLLNNDLMRKVLAVRLDSLWRMIGLMSKGLLPGPDAEGATGDLDNKGGLFIPGGLVFSDSDRRPVRPEKTGPFGPKVFGKGILDALRHDNATLVFRDGLAIGVNLDNGFFAEIAGNILANKQAAHKRRPPFEPLPAMRIDSTQITRSHCPTYMPAPYGSRTRLSSCIAVCLMEPRMYYVACRKELGLRGDEEERTVWKDISDARKPILGRGDRTLTSPCVVVCHTTRYHKRNLVGLTRLLGYGRFGEFSTLTMERISSGLLTEAAVNLKPVPPQFVAAESGGVQFAAVLRTYPPTRLGRRQKKTTTQLIALRDLGLDPEAIASRAMDRYKSAIEPGPELAKIEL